MCHFQRQLDYRIGQPFALSPLFPQDSVDAEHDEDVDYYKQHPPQYRRDPCAYIAGCVKSRLALIVPCQNPPIAYSEPIRKVSVEQLSPLVLRRGEPVSVPYCGYENLHHIMRTEAGHGREHHVAYQKLALAESKLW